MILLVHDIKIIKLTVTELEIALQINGSCLKMQPLIRNGNLFLNYCLCLDIKYLPVEKVFNLIKSEFRIYYLNLRDFWLL